MPGKPASRSFDPVVKLAICAEAFLFGALQPHEAVMEGFARALGYRTAGELRAALRDSDPKFWERREALVERLYRRFRYDPRTGTSEDLMNFADELMRAIPKDLLRRVRLEPRKGSSAH
jgi:hypothetical protein